MPHKKRKNKAQDKLDDELADLAPSERLSSTGTHSKPRKRNNAVKDDTPKDFLRLMERIKTGSRKKDGLDDGNSSRQSKKRKREEASSKASTTSGAATGTAAKKPKPTNTSASTTEATASSTLKILPGESLRDFNRRVDASLPHIRAKSGVPHKSHLKKLRKAEKAAAKAAALRGSRSPSPDAAEAELSDDYDPEKDEVVPLPYEAPGKKKRGGRQKSPDPWEELKKKREQPKFWDVAQAPPELVKVKELLWAPGARNVPKAAGSLAKRETLGGERERIIEGYRAMMKGRGEGGLMREWVD